MCECKVKEVETLECLPRLQRDADLQTVTVLPGLCVCQVCLGSGTVWLSEHESNWLGTAVQCWECQGRGTRYEPTTSE
ncbi:MAG: hypothetical protein WC565_04710 [Parcubacteria group bacterium]